MCYPFTPHNSAVRSVTALFPVFQNEETEEKEVKHGDKVIGPMGGSWDPGPSDPESVLGTTVPSCIPL